MELRVKRFLHLLGGEGHWQNIHGGQELPLVLRRAWMEAALFAMGEVTEREHLEESSEM